MKTGLEFLKNPGTTAGEIAEVLATGHPPFEPGTKVDCSHVTCRECWLAWLITGKAPVEKETAR
ncbi:MAG: hypothetical protein IJZ39_11710 [Oscillospiraceae bacterium]|nr:hypothetical protein [Oscillospiraceae bacterium]